MERPLSVRASVTVAHYKAYAFDPSTGLYLRRLVSEEKKFNLVTDAGRVGIHTYIYGTAAQRAAASPVVSNVGLNYIALSNDGSAPANGDTSLTGELSGDGLSRVQGTVTLPTGSGTVTTISHTFTYAGVSQAVQKTALFDASSGGRMAHEILFTSKTLTTGDQLTLNFEITLALEL